MSKKAKHGAPHEEHADETWLIPYADLLTLLLALFIVLFATSKTDKAKMEQMEASFMTAFNIPNPSKQTGNIVGFLADAQGLDLGEDVRLGSDSQGAVLEITNLALFDPGEAELKESGVPIVKKIAGLLMATRYDRFRITVEGHTDSAKIESTHYPTNWELSAARAARVVRIFVGSGITPERLQAVGKADIEPKYPNYDADGNPIEENMAKNRRVVIKIEPWF